MNKEEKMSEQIRLNDVSPATASDLKAGDEAYVQSGSLLADPSNRVWMKGYAKISPERSTSFCVKAEVDQKGLNVDLRACGDWSTAIPVERSLAVGDAQRPPEGFLPVMNLNKVDPPGLVEQMRQWLGIDPPTPKQSFARNGQALVPNTLKSGSLLDFKPGETVYVQDYSLIADGDQHGVWLLPPAGEKLRGFPTQVNCLKVNIVPDGARVDGSLCNQRLDSSGLGVDAQPKIRKSLFTNEKIAQFGSDALPVVEMKGVLPKRHE